MSRANNGGWDFVKVGETYQYKEEAMPGLYFLADVKILEDNSNEDEYAFKLQVEKSNMTPPSKDGVGIFDIMWSKKFGGYFGGMTQIYETPEYEYEVKWDRANLETE